MNKRTIQFVPSSEIVSHFVPQQNIGQFYSEWCNDWSWGDTTFAIVDSREFLDSLGSFLQWLDVKADVDKVEKEYWEIVGEEVYIDIAS
jgi:hypothetical protein